MWTLGSLLRAIKTPIALCQRAGIAKGAKPSLHPPLAAIPLTEKHNELRIFFLIMGNCDMI